MAMQKKTLKNFNHYFARVNLFYREIHKLRNNEHRKENHFSNFNSNL